MIERRLGSATRDAYGKALVEIGNQNPNLVVLDADLSKSTKTEIFGKAHPERFIDIGIQECNLVGIAAGLAISGKVPFISSFACFLMCKGYDQLRMCVAFPNLNVKVVTSHGGISVGEDGASQQSVEDIALACTLPNFVVMVPADEFQARALTKLAAAYHGPVYIRTGRPKAPMVYNEKSTFEIGRAVRLREGKDLTIVAAGLLVFEALEAADLLAKDGISAAVVDSYTIKPLDEDLIIEQAKKTGAVLVAEEHLIWGGLGSAVSQCLSKNYPVLMDFVGLEDTYAESGKPAELLEKYGLTSKNISQVARRLVARKTK